MVDSDRRDAEMAKIYDGCNADEVEKLVQEFPICCADAVKIIKRIEVAKYEVMQEHLKELVVFSKEVIDVCAKHLDSRVISRGDVVATLEMAKTVFLGR